MGFQLQMNYHMAMCIHVSVWYSVSLGQIFPTKEMSVNALIPYLYSTPYLCKYSSIFFFRDDLVGSLSTYFSWKGILFMMMADEVARFP